MGKLFTKKENASSKKKKDDSLSISERIRAVIFTELPLPLQAKCQPLIFISLAFIAASFVLLVVPSLRTMAPFSLMISLLVLIFAYMRRREMVLTGYDEYLFRTLDYTYLLKRQRDKGSPTGVVLLGIEGTENNNVENQIYHIAVDGGTNMPDLDCILRVYVPKNAVVSVYGSRKFFSKVFAYDVESYDLQ